MDALRRSRMHRTGSTKPIALTLRDLDVFRWLLRYRYLRSTYLHAFAGGASEKRFVERLCELFHHGFVNRAPQQWRFANARCQPLVYEAAVRAKSLLVATAGDDARRTFLGPAAHRQFEHSLMMCQCLASLELATLARSGLRFIPWPEILARAPQETRTSRSPFRLAGPAGEIVPDGLFGLEYRSTGKSAYRFFTLEVDRGTMPLMRSGGSHTSYLAKLATYRGIIQCGVAKAELGIPNLFVLTVTTNRLRLSSLLQLASQQGGNPFFLFAAVDEIGSMRPAAELLGSPWKRADFPPLSIAESCCLTFGAGDLGICAETSVRLEGQKAGAGDSNTRGKEVFRRPSYTENIHIHISTL